MTGSTHGERKKLLLIDDDEAVLDYLCIKLGGEFELITTTSADDVLALMREGRPDLVLCDISVTLFSHEDTRHVPLLFLTSLASPTDLKASGNQLGGRSAISKQAPIEDIVARIRASLAP